MNAICIGVMCPPAVRPRCNVGETWQVNFVGEKSCCRQYSCECDEDNCPDTSLMVYYTSVIYKLKQSIFLFLDM